jgi:hypothetical protein
MYISKEAKKNLKYNIITQSRVNKNRGKSLNDYSLLKKSMWEKAHQLTAKDKQQFIDNLQKELEQETALEQWKKQSISSKKTNIKKQYKGKLARKYKYDENPEQDTSRVDRNKMYIFNDDIPHDSRREFVQKNSKFYCQLIDVPYVEWKYDALLKSVTQMYKKYAKKTARNYMNLSATLVTISYDKEDQEATRKEIKTKTLFERRCNSHAARTTNFEIINEAALESLVQNFMTRTQEEIDKASKNSSHYIEIEACKPLTLILKDILPNQGGSYVEMSENYKKFLFNPKVSHSCFWACMKEAKVEFNKSIPEIMDDLKMDYRSMVGTTKINKILEYCKEKIRINIYQFKNEGNDIKRSKYPKTGEVDKIINLLLVKNHFILILNMKEFSKTKVTDFNVVDTSKVDQDNYQLPLQYKSRIFKQIKEDQPIISKYTYM